MNYIINISRLTLIALILGGCSSTGFLPPMSDSVANLTEQQTQRQPSYIPPTGSTAKLDGDQGAQVLEAFRTSIAKPPEINNEITVNVGG